MQATAWPGLRKGQGSGKDNLFQLFRRLHSSKDYEGTGIGLMTVRRCCELFGGRVWAEGKPDQGATFWFAWPKQPKAPGPAPSLAAPRSPG